MTSMNIAIQGMKTQMENMASSASNIANAGTAGAPEIDMPAEMVGLLHSQHMFEANLAVIRISDNMAGELLDILV